MAKFLRLHPYSMRAEFNHCIMATFKVPERLLSELLPRPLVPDTYKDHAFISVVISALKYMRPYFLPKFLGINYHQVLYRTPVLLNGERGVYFLQSQANNRLMTLGGQLFSIFNLNYNPIRLTPTDRGFDFHLKAPSQRCKAIRSHYIFEKKHSAKSLFPTLEEVRSFLLERFRAFHITKKGRLTHIEVERKPWLLRPMKDTIQRYEYLQNGSPFNLNNTEMDHILYGGQIDYEWSKLKYYHHGL